MHSNSRFFRCAIVAALLSLGLASAAQAALAIVQGDYKLPATVDASVTTELATELWARVCRADSGGALPVIGVGAEQFALSRFPVGRADRLIFTLSGPQFDALAQGAPVTVNVGGAVPWAFGALCK